ncbi:TPA: glutamine amidotransferase [Candidatus Gastranaerophilales bacterium HUM_9]|mgnify:FL=1|nr:MAG TPA: glutamine amidotransferase [Candidatus Gastranaerophilales bacterium HUM_9]HBX34290.1 glutamine amidotransferase [Cyanobacteria bacterium UBA11440]
MTQLKLKLVHLYPLFLNLYGDAGNILTLKKRCEWRGIDLEIEHINIDDKIEEGTDIYFIGGGQDRQQVEVSEELQKHKSILTAEYHNDAVFLGICGGYQLMGEYYQPHDAKRLEGIGLLDAYTVAGSTRFIGNVTAEVNYLMPTTIVGFENHSGLTYLNTENGDTKPMATIMTGKGNNGQDKTEGARSRNAFGTYLHGSFLPKNPHFADYLIKLALRKRYNDDIELEPLDDSLEFNAHNSVLNKQY